MGKSIQKGAYRNIDTFIVCTLSYMYLVQQIGICKGGIYGNRTFAKLFT